MNNDITNTFGTLYHPVKAFVLYQQEQGDKNIYVESYDMDSKGYPINAHPLSVRESTALSKALDSSAESKHSFLKPAGLLPSNVLYINPYQSGYAVWYTPPQKIDLLFADSLTIPNGKAHIPALLWKASKDSLYVYALKSSEYDLGTPLYHAPFFNVYEDGRVCMGTVSINIKKDCLLEAFMRTWETYFFKSYFSHLFQGHQPVKGNIIQLWQSLIGTRRKFPMKSLIKTNRTVKHIIQ